MIRIGLAGTGSMGSAHAHAYASIPGAHVVAVVDEDRARAEPIAESLSAHVYPDLDAMFAAAPDGGREGSREQLPSDLREAHSPDGERRQRDDRGFSGGRS